MAATVVIVSKNGLSIDACHRNQPKLLIHFLILIYNSYTQVTRQSASVIKVGVAYMGRHYMYQSIED